MVINDHFITDTDLIKGLIRRIKELQEELDSVKSKAVKLEDDDEAYLILKYYEKDGETDG